MIKVFKIVDIYIMLIKIMRSNYLINKHNNHLIYHKPQKH